MAWYRLVAGKHYEDKKEYKPGDVFESNTDLVDMFNLPQSHKFELVNKHGQPLRDNVASKEAPNTVVDEVALGDGLEDMNVAELKAYAMEEEIDLGNAKRKDEIISEIRKAMVSTAAEQGFSS